MSRHQLIEDKLKQQFSPSFLQVENETQNHNVPPDSESHFKVLLVSEDFKDKSLIQRHRMVNQCLADELKNAIHALAMHTFTASEWEEREFKEMKSPPCHGGSK
ncbi:MAG: BolA/IbaG family iron-sulfur metabolism protein [Pseudomonadota bacterium]